MNNDYLVRKLNSVGKQAFVENFELFNRYASGKITKEESISILVNEGISVDNNGAAIRVGNAKKIFDNCGELEALRNIVQSKRLSDTVKREAKRLIAYTVKNS